MGMLGTEEQIEQLMAWGPERAGAYFHPGARGDDRFLASDFYGWMILLDGQFDGLAGQDSGRAEAVVQGLLAVLDPHTAPSAPVLAGERALADVWRRLCSGMSPAWRERAAKDLSDFITAYRTESAHRATRMCLSPEKYLRLRFDSGGTGIILDITERLHGFEIPAMAWAHPLIQRMRDESLVERFQEIKGVGPYTAAVMASPASRDLSVFGIDVWNRKIFARSILGVPDADAEVITRRMNTLFPGHAGTAALYLVEHEYLAAPVAPLLDPAGISTWNQALEGTTA
ncbi:hypothetical protein GPJ59_02475 [Streptomyces bambusae]|uniref:HhH-GPD domain-containing protein n=2 Tax=Streptomyces bambusae TaxID=1550616 RepID=A0ABS6YZ80_9ACTN|nr:hypothetical protein [Streptomyces bambusae]